MERYKEYLETKYSPLLEKRFKDLKKKKLSASKMNKREVKSYYKEMNSPSLDFLRSTNNQLRLYVDWLINEKNDKISQQIVKWLKANLDIYYLTTTCI